MWRRVARCVASAAIATSACAGDERRAVRLERVAPEADLACGAPEDARLILVTALGDFPPSEATVSPIEVADGTGFPIDDFPAETRILEVEVRGLGGVTRTIGRTPRFELVELDDGAVLPVFMAPPDGFCPTGPPVQARRSPLAARVGTGVLLAGGYDAEGEPVHQVEVYDPSTGQFSGLGEPLYGSDLAVGLAGAMMTRMDDGRVVVTGGAATAYQIYDPDGDGFGGAQFLRESRAYHAAIALDADRLLLAGGCARLEGDDCTPGALLTTTSILSLSSGELEDGPGLTRPRIGGAALRAADGSVLLHGGVDDAGAPVIDAERIDPDGAGQGDLVSPVGAAAATLAAGGALFGFAPAGAEATASLTVVAPGAGSPSEVDGAAEPRAGATLVALENGQVLVVGGAAGGTSPAALYTPAAGSVEPVPGAPGIAAAGLVAVRLDDGAVLVTGGEAPGGGAWIFRPSLRGPLTGGLSVTFSTPASAAPMVPRDPARAELVPAAGPTPAHYLLHAVGDRDDGRPSDWAVMAGPQFGDVLVEASLAAEAGGVGVLLWFRDEANTAMVALRPGSPAGLVVIEGGELVPSGSCSGDDIGAAELAPSPGAAHEVIVRAAAGDLEATVDGRSVLRCAFDPPAPGLVGVAPLGDDATARIDLLSATR